MLKVVTLLSTLRDPMQLRQLQCANRQQRPFFRCTLLSSRKFDFRAPNQDFIQIFCCWPKAEGWFCILHWKKTPQILIADQKEKIDRTQKSPAIQQKKFGKGLEDFVRDFCCWPPPMWCLKAKKTQIPIEFLDRTPKKSS